MAFALAGCSPAGAANDVSEGDRTLTAQTSGPIVNVHCVGRVGARSPASGDVSVKPLTADYEIDQPNNRLLQYSVEKQVVEPVGSAELCRTTVTDKLARVECHAAHTLPDGRTEAISTTTRLDRVLGKLSYDVLIEKNYIRGGAADTVNALTVRADCQPGVDPTTIRKF